jgi:hypothetical protein
MYQKSICAPIGLLPCRAVVLTGGGRETTWFGPPYLGLPNYERPSLIGCQYQEEETSGSIDERGNSGLTQSGTANRG